MIVTLLRATSVHAQSKIRSLALEDATITEYAGYNDGVPSSVSGFVKELIAIKTPGIRGTSIFDPNVVTDKNKAIYLTTVDNARDIDFGVILSAETRNVSLVNNLQTNVTVDAILFNSNFGIFVDGVSVGTTINAHSTHYFTVTVDLQAIFKNVDTHVVLVLSDGTEVSLRIRVERVVSLAYTYLPDLKSYSESYKLKTTILTFTDGTESRQSLTTTEKKVTTYDITFGSSTEVHRFANTLKYGMVVPLPQPLWTNFITLPYLQAETTINVDTPYKLGMDVGVQVLIRINDEVSVLATILAVTDTSIVLDKAVSCPAGSLMVPTFIGIPDKSSNLTMDHSSFGKASLKIMEV